MRDRSFAAQTKIWMAVIATIVMIPATASRAEDSTAGLLTNFAPVRASPSERVVQFDLMRSARCFFGDLDLIMNDLQTADGNVGLQLTVETVGGSEPGVYFADAMQNMNPKSNLGTYEVTLPRRKGGRVYGVFLCSVKESEAGKVPCSKQSLQSFDAAFAPYRVDSSSLKAGGASSPYTPPAEVAPKLYFAQFFVDDGRSLSLITNVDSPKLTAALQTSGIATGDSKESAGLIRRYSQTLGSSPLQWSDERVRISLPFFSETKCNG